MLILYWVVAESLSKFSADSACAQQFPDLLSTVLAYTQWVSACAQQCLSMYSALSVKSQHMLSKVLVMLVDAFGNWIDSFSEANILKTPLSVSLMIWAKIHEKSGLQECNFLQTQQWELTRTPRITCQGPKLGLEAKNFNFTCVPSCPRRTSGT